MGYASPLSTVQYLNSSFKEPVRAASISNINIAAPLGSLDGVALSIKDRVLLKNQLAPEENGIYVITSTFNLQRAADSNQGDKIRSGLIISIQEGTANKDTVWFLTTNAPITIGVTPLNFISLGSSTPIQVTSYSGNYTCPGSVAIGDVVYLTGSLAVDKADNTLPATTPILGIVSEKPTLTTATIIYAGEISAYGGLVPNTSYFLGVAGSITSTPPSTTGTVIQRVGIAVSNSTLILRIGEKILL